jgi:hypothetical protein
VDLVVPGVRRALDCQPSYIEYRSVLIEGVLPCHNSLA